MITIANVYSSMLFMFASGCLKASKTMSQASPPFGKPEGGKLFSPLPMKEGDNRHRFGCSPGANGRGYYIPKRRKCQYILNKKLINS